MRQPIRLRLSRAKGFNLQQHSRDTNGLPAINVARPTKWGNPFPVGHPGPMGRTALDNEGAVGFFSDMLSDPALRLECSYPTNLSPLAGHNLACWCALNEPCHADVLLERVNAPAPKVGQT